MEDYLDALLLHRPDALVEPEEVASTDENACLQGLVDKIDTMLPKLELSQESEVLALTQGAEI